jgi:hypothetical protein
MREEAMFDSQIEVPFEGTRGRTFWTQVIDVLKGGSQRLLSFDEVRDKLHMGSQSYMGISAVEVTKIAGSVGRYQDFDRDFNPLQSHTAHRRRAIAKALHEGDPLPPVKLYKVGEAYFVRDGHHRVSVARELGIEYVDAEVIECHSRVPITPDVTSEELNLKAEYVEFLEATDLDRLRPDQDISFTVSGTYKILLEHIAVHRHFLGLERGEAIPWQEAVLSWYDNLYRPIVDIIQQQGILAEFPARTEADLYLWIIDHHYYLAEEREVDFAGAAEDFADEYSQRPAKKILRGAQRLLEEVVEEIPLITDTEAEQSE